VFKLLDIGRFLNEQQSKFLEKKVKCEIKGIQRFIQQHIV